MSRAPSGASGKPKPTPNSGVKAAPDASNPTTETDLSKGGATAWILEAARRVPYMLYVIGVVALVAAAAVALGFMLGNWEYALWGGATVFVAMVVVRLYATTTIASAEVNITWPATLII